MVTSLSLSLERATTINRLTKTYAGRGNYNCLKIALLRHCNVFRRDLYLPDSACFQFQQMTQTYSRITWITWTELLTVFYFYR